MNYLLAVVFNWYGLIIGSAMLVCIVGAYYLLKKRGYNPDIVFTVAIICIPCAILGARIYYIAFDILGGQGTYQSWFIGQEGGFSLMRFLGFVKTPDGWDYRGLAGLAVYGGLIAAALGAFIVRAINKKDKNPRNQMTYTQMLDAFFVFIILGQIIGRWGNFANQEAYGNAVNNPAFQRFPFAVFITKEGSWFQATFFYESFFNLIGFGIMLYLLLGRRKSFDGFVFAFYCIWYGLVRFFVEGLRSDSLYLGVFRVSQLLSVFLILLGAGIIIYHVVRSKAQNKKIFIFTQESLLSTDYLDYNKSIMYLCKTYNKDGTIKSDQEGISPTHDLNQDNLAKNSAENLEENSAEINSENKD